MSKIYTKPFSCELGDLHLVRPSRAKLNEFVVHNENATFEEREAIVFHCVEFCLRDKEGNQVYTKEQLMNDVPADLIGVIYNAVMGNDEKKS